jgi:polyisoprenoid-binding protein YceI
MGAVLAWSPPARSLSPSATLPSSFADGVRTIGFDTTHTRFGFELRTRWGQRVQGWFPQHDGALMKLPDGRNQVRIQLATAAVEVEGSERWAAIARGPRFFDAERYPQIEFVSEPHPPSLGHDGGRLRGKLTMHGVSRIETFVVAPATCARPGVDCDVVASGSVDRGRYGLDGWKLAMTDTVRFNMRVRLQTQPPPAGDAPANADGAR